MKKVAARVCDCVRELFKCTRSGRRQRLWSFNITKTAYCSMYARRTIDIQIMYSISRRWCDCMSTCYFPARLAAVCRLSVLLYHILVRVCVSVCACVRVYDGVCVVIGFWYNLHEFVWCVCVCMRVSAVLPLPLLLQSPTLRLMRRTHILFILLFHSVRFHRFLQLCEYQLVICCCRPDRDYHKKSQHFVRDKLLK